jgi:parallel beta-helix repeat protein
MNPYIYMQNPDFMPQPGGGTPIAPQPGSEEGAGSAQPSPPEKIIKMQAPGNSFEFKKLILPIVAVMVIIVLVIVASHFIKPSNSTTSTTTTIQNTGFVSSCRALNAPGTYTLGSNISTSMSSGSCLNITASNVQLSCNGYGIKGSGPYSGVGPFTYGIAVKGSNVGITGCTIGNFSYGIYSMPGSSGLNIHNNTLSYNYVSNIYMAGTGSSNVYLNNIYGSESNTGSVYITANSSGDAVYNNTIGKSAIKGIFINSTGNSFYNNKISSTPSAFECTAYAGLVKSNRGYGNACLNNTGCSFLACRVSNTPPNLTQISLGSSVSGCGAINFPGTYSLSSNINMEDYVNTSSLGFLNYVPCIDVRVSKVTLNCNNYAITNASVGIMAEGMSNISINNCRINSTPAGVGIDLYNISGSSISNITIIRAGTGISLAKSSQNKLTGLSAKNSLIGILLSSSYTNNLNDFNSSNNSYGIYVENSTGNIFNGGVANGNLALDVYADNLSSKANYNLMTSTGCGFTNAVWAPCKTHISASLSYYPVNSCTTISKGGNYSLRTSIVPSTTGTCINIDTSNVVLRCHGYRLAPAVASSPGTAILVSNANNVTVEGCRISDFSYAIRAVNSTALNITNITSTSPSTGIALQQVNSSFITKDTVSSPSGYGIAVSDSKSDIITFNNVSLASTQSFSGIMLNNSIRNIVQGNKGKSNYIGLQLLGNSVNNTIMNNTMSGSGAYDYECSPQSSSLGSENGGVNYGAVKYGCHWNAVLTPFSNLHCSPSFSSNRFSLSTDHQYSAGANCFDIYGNTTTLDCNGHTIISNNGGTLMYAKNATAIVQNCYIKGFQNVLAGKNSTLKLLNDTILLNSTSMAYDSALNATGGTSVSIQDDNITAQNYGVILTNVNRGSVLNDVVKAGSVAYSIINSSGISFSRDVSYPGSGIGIILNGSTDISMQDNQFNGTLFGIQCLGRSQSSSNVTDLGGNSCSSQTSCTWINPSSSTCR